MKTHPDADTGQDARPDHDDNHDADPHDPHDPHDPAPDRPLAKVPLIQPRRVAWEL